MPDGHELSLGAMTTAPQIWEALTTADVVLAVGTEFSETDYFYAPTLQPPDLRGTLVRIDIDADQLARRPAPTSRCTATRPPRWRRWRGPSTGRGGDAVARAEELRERLEPLRGHRAVPAVPRGAAGGAAGGRDPRRRLDAARLRGPQLWPARRPWDYISPAGFGTLGPALPMAIGAKIAAPDRTVACLAGDGGFLFTVQELATAADEGLALPILLWQNHGYGEIRDSMDRINVPYVGVDSSARDFVRLAEGFGVAGVRVDSLNAMQDAFRAAAAADRPTLIEVPADLR